MMLFRTIILIIHTLYQIHFKTNIAQHRILLFNLILSRFSKYRFKDKKESWQCEVVLVQYQYYRNTDIENQAIVTHEINVDIKSIGLP